LACNLFNYGVDEKKRRSVQSWIECDRPAQSAFMFSHAPQYLPACHIGTRAAEDETGSRAGSSSGALTPAGAPDGRSGFQARAAADGDLA